MSISGFFDRQNIWKIVCHFSLIGYAMLVGDFDHYILTDDRCWYEQSLQIHHNRYHTGMMQACRPGLPYGMRLQLFFGLTRREPRRTRAQSWPTQNLTGRRGIPTDQTKVGSELIRL
jgi:hypothetical protein